MGEDISSLFVSYCIRTRFLNFDTTGILDGIIHCCGGCPVNCRMFTASLASAHQMPVTPLPNLRQPKMSLDVAKCLLKGKITSTWKLLFKEIQTGRLVHLFLTVLLEIHFFFCYFYPNAAYSETKWHIAIYIYSFVSSHVPAVWLGLCWSWLGSARFDVKLQMWSGLFQFLILSGSVAAWIMFTMKSRCAKRPAQ